MCIRDSINPKVLPPCIRKILIDIENGENIPHQARFAVTSMLLSLGLKVEEIVSLFSKSPDFDEEKTKYQIEHIAGRRGGGTRYTPPSCSTMRTYGICYGRDRICDSITHPISYVRKVWKKNGLKRSLGSTTQKLE